MQLSGAGQKSKLGAKCGAESYVEWGGEMLPAKEDSMWKLRDIQNGGSEWEGEMAEARCCRSLAFKLEINTGEAVSKPLV